MAPRTGAIAGCSGRKGRRFKDRIVEEDVREDWFAFRDEAHKKIAADFLESQGIPFIDDRNEAGRG